MRLSISEYEVDISETPIENMFINQFLPVASGDDVKVYIYLYKLARENREIDLEKISEELNISSLDLHNSLYYWINLGLISMKDEGFEFVSIRELFLGVKKVNQAINDPYPNTKEDLPSSEAENIDINESNTLMFREIERLLDTKLLPNEIEKINSHLDEFKQDRDLIVTAFKYLGDEVGKKNVNYTIAALRNWAIDGVLTVKDFEEKIIGSEKKAPRPNKKREKLNSSNRIGKDKVLNLLKKKQMESLRKTMDGDEN